jgi:hypothetical protein
MASEFFRRHAVLFAAGVAGMVVFVWLLVALPLAAYWYTRRNTGNGAAPPPDPMVHWPPPPP